MSNSALARRSFQGVCPCLVYCHSEDVLLLFSASVSSSDELNVYDLHQGSSETESWYYESGRGLAYVDSRGLLKSLSLG